MAQEQSKAAMQAPTRLKRVFEQPPDAISLYSDVAQIIGTGDEVQLQFYETIPGVPGPKGAPEIARSRLRATVTMSRAHAANIGQLLLQQSEVEPARIAAEPRPESEQ